MTGQRICITAEPKDAAGLRTATEARASIQIHFEEAKFDLEAMT